MDKLSMLIHYLSLLSFVACIFAKVEWKVEEKISAYGEDLRLLCTTDDYSINGGKIKRWEGGPKQKMLTLNGAPDQEDVMKYKMPMQKDGFILVIKNVSKADLNVTYECTYGFKTSGKVMLKTEDAFEERQATKQSEGKNNTILYVIIIVTLVVLAAVAICISLLFRRRKRKLKVRKNTDDLDCNENSESRERLSCLIQMTDPEVGEHPDSASEVPPLVSDCFLPESNSSNGESVEDAMAVSVQELVPSTEKPYNTQPVDESSNDTCLIDPAPSALTEPNELDSELPDQICEHGDEMETKVLFASIPPQHSELVTSVTGSEALEPYKTESDGDSVDETSLKDVAKDHASSEPVKIAPQRDFQYSKPDEQETEVHSTVNFKLKREYKTFNLRKKSFNSSSCKWPLPKPSIPEMANAGFFCSGCLTWVQCYSCGLKRLWQEGEDPFDEHLHDNCSHLIHIKEKKASGEGS